MEIRYIIPFVFLFASSLTAFAGTIKGKVIDEENNPLPFASVTLLSNDSTFVAGTITDDNGAFLLDDMSDAGRLVRFSYIGYSETLIPVDSLESGIIMLLPDSQMLSEVVVKAHKPQIRMKGNAMITTVAGSMLEKSGSANRLLDRIPNVRIIGQQAEVFGSGNARIYVNSREIRDFSELERISADNIRQVEVENNPGTRYGSDVNAVIRIITKSDSEEGFGIDNSFLSGYHSGWNYADRISMNYRKNHLDVGGTVSWKDYRTGEKKTIIQDTYSDNFSLNQHSKTKSNLHTQNLNTAFWLNYGLGETSSMGVRYDYLHQPSENEVLRMNTEVTSERSPYELSMSETSVYNSGTRHALSYYYSGSIGKLKIDFNSDALWNNAGISSTANEEVLPYGESDWQKICASSSTDSRSSLYAANLQLKYPLWIGELTAGGEYSRTSRYDKYADSFSNQTSGDMNIIDDMFYAFVEYGGTSGSAQWQTGLRYESINSEYREDGERIAPQCREYRAVFPFASMLVTAGNVKLQLSYRSGTERPTYSQLRNNIIYANRYTYEGGNPMLRHMTSHKASLTASYRWANLTADFMRLKNGIVSTFIPYDANPMVGLFTYMQCKPYNRINLSLTLSPVIGIWSPRWGIQLSQNRFTSMTPSGNRKMYHPVAMFSWHNNIRLPHSFIVSLDMGYTAGGDMENISYGALWRMDAMIYKGFMNDRFSISLNVDDIFHSSGANSTLYTPLRILHSCNKSDTNIGITLRYKFNVLKNNYRGKGAGNEQKLRL